MDREALLAFLKAHDHGVQASLHDDGRPQAAVVGLAVTDELELVFDTLGDTRKAANLRQDPRIALVVGWDHETVQLEGVADEPQGEELERVRAAYFRAFPEGGPERAGWPGITWFRVKVRWARYSDFRGAAPVIEVVDLSR
ncbi:MAG: pyridoxamine 5'-phosphate oxidase family protein [Myxococcales bacterium]|nr:pyridoxamine 5'-phosphate oxidase family protein [Myxococcales bacterium]MCB9733936.1 pyridoxamine 5'-phosphate oxidase family protein [Deltaproteobacteria bacterium]